MLHENNINEFFILYELKNVKEVTIENIKNYRGFEHMSETESAALLSTLETYSEVILNQTQRDTYYE